MALELLLSNEGFYPYRDCSAAIVGGPYGAFCQGSSEYRESIAQLESFVYDAATDRYYMVALHNQVDYPSWNVTYTTIHPETGEISSQRQDYNAVVGQAWTSNMWNGGLNKIYARWITSEIVEVDPRIGIPTDAQIANPIVGITQIPDIGFWIGPSLVCPERKLITGHSQTALETAVYDYSDYPAAATYLWGQSYAESNPWSAAYENDQTIWTLYSQDFFGISASGKQSLIKYNYVHNRVELLSELQPGALDRMALIAWDSKRKKLAAARFRDDNADGGPNNVFQIYAPRPAVVRITVPVNINRLSPTIKTQFRAHLLGTKGEGGTNKPVTVDNDSTLGTLPRKTVYTVEGGSMGIEYQSSTDQMEDTLTVSFEETKVTE